MMDNDKELEALFSEAREAVRPVSDDLMARVLSDANAVQAEGLAQKPAMNASVQHGAPIWSFFGGWIGAVSFAACAAVGIYLGYSVESFAGLSLTGVSTSLEDGIYGNLALLDGGI